MKLTMRLVLMKDKITNFAFLLFSIQIMLNNSIKSFIEIFFNEIIYKFKVMKLVDLFFIKDTRIHANDKNSFIAIKEERNFLKKKAKEVIVLTQIMQIMRYNSRHTSMNWKIDNRVYIILHKEYNQINIENRKFDKQRVKLAEKIEKIEKFIYRLRLFEN